VGEANQFPCKHQQSQQSSSIAHQDCIGQSIFVEVFTEFGHK